MKKVLFLNLLILAGCSKSVDREPTPVPTLAPPYNRQVNGNLTVNGNVSERFKVSNDKTKIVYVADETNDGIEDLYVTDVTLNSRLNLSQLVGAGKRVTQFQISPNSQKIAFLADIANTGRFDLHTVNMDGSGLVQVNLGLSAAGMMVVDNFKWTSESSRIVFVSDEESIGVKNVYVVEANGANRLRLNTISNVFNAFALAPDNSRVVYRVNSVNPDVRSVTLSATGDVRLNSLFNLGLNPASGVFDFQINEQSTKVVYRANQDDDAVTELYTVNLDGTGGVSKVNGTMVVGGSVVAGYSFSANGSKVVYMADQDADEVQEIYVANVNGIGFQKLNTSLVTGGDVSAFKISPDDSRVVFLADKDVDNANELYSVSILGGTISKINSVLVAGEQVSSQFDIVGSQVVYAMDRGQVGLYSIYSNLITGINEIRLTPAISTGQGFFNVANLTADQFFLTNDASRIIVLGSAQGPIRNIYSVSLDGSNFTQINDNSQDVLLSNTGLGSTAISVAPYVVYRQNNGLENNLIIGLFK